MKSTKDLHVPEKIIEQVIGQDEATEIMKKAALQRRHVLLIGEPGTGKSMLGFALAELLPKSELKDILALPNPHDENNPQIQELPAGKGREEAKKYLIDTRQMIKNNNLLLFAVALLTFIAPWWVRQHYNSDLMFTAFFLGGMLFLAAFSIMMNVGPRMFKMNSMMTPKVIVDNFGKKEVPFFDATGAHAGALLGDVLHDPFQSLNSGSIVVVVDRKTTPKLTPLQELLDSYFTKWPKQIITEKENNYEAIYLPKGELFVLGETKGSISPVEVLSSNRYSYEGEMIKLTTSENEETIVTPEHKIAVWRAGQKEYVEAQEIKEGDEVVAKSKGIIIDAEDIINTYDAPQQEQSRLYHQYLETKAANPLWGYKRIAKSLGLEEHKTRWWHSKKHVPAPVQTVNWLKKRGLLPLTIDHHQLSAIAKVLGATFGDGGIFENLNGIFLSSSEKEAVEEFGRDLESIFGLEHDENSRIIEGGGYGHSWCYQNTNRNIIRFFVALGAPRGNKTKLELITPGWLQFNEAWESEFYGSFIGGELGTPIIHKTGNHLTTLELGITGRKELERNRYDFLTMISTYLHKKNVCTTSIYTRRLNPDSTIYRLLIGKEFDNVLYFMANIKINYCKYKIDRLYRALGQWAVLKKKKYNELLERGYGAEAAMNLLNLTPNSLYLLLNHFGPRREITP